MAAVAAGERQRFEEPRDALVEDGASVTTGLVAKRAGDPALADAAGPGDQAVLMAVDPVAGRQACDERAVQPARRTQVDVLDAGVLPERSKLQPGCEPLGVALGRLAVGHDADAFLEAERGEIGRGALLFEGLGHAGEAERDQALMGGMGEHWVSWFEDQWK